MFDSNQAKEVICRMKTKIAALNYQLTDILEMNYSTNPEAIKAFKQALFARPIQDFNLYSLSCFTFEDVVAVIQNEDLNPLKRLYLLNSQDESFKTYCLHSIHHERGMLRGRKLNDLLKSERFAPA